MTLVGSPWTLSTKRVSNLVVLLNPGLQAIQFLLKLGQHSTVFLLVLEEFQFHPIEVDPPLVLPHGPHVDSPHAFLGFSPKLFV